MREYYEKLNQRLGELKKVPLTIHETRNTYTVPSQPGVDHVTIEVWDRATGASLAPYSLSLTVVE